MESSEGGKRQSVVVNAVLTNREGTDQEKQNFDY